MTTTPWHWQSLTELSHHIQSGALSPVELMEHLLARVEALDGALNSFRLVPQSTVWCCGRASLASAYDIR
jgi:Asp-tRNA(Asn)/Glu-tRNA(Gln) amidotransferase A subunit family amidase